MSKMHSSFNNFVLKNENYERRKVLKISGAIIICGLVPNMACAHTSKISAIISSNSNADRKLKDLMPAIVEEMKTDRCFIYMRDPIKRQTAFTHGFTPLSGWRSFSGGTWSREPDPQTVGEPMLKKAFSDPTALFIEDIETAAPSVLNKDVERSIFGHRALVHAPIYHRDVFYGILETAVRKEPRMWSAKDRSLIEWLQPRVARLVAEYLGHLQQ